MNTKVKYCWIETAVLAVIIGSIVYGCAYAVEARFDKLDRNTARIAEQLEIDLLD